MAWLKPLMPLSSAKRMTIMGDAGGFLFTPMFDWATGYGTADKHGAVSDFSCKYVCGCCVYCVYCVVCTVVGLREGVEEVSNFNHVFFPALTLAPTSTNPLPPAPAPRSSDPSSI